MACKTCNKSDFEKGVCRCHELIEGDTKTRLVKFCDLCGVYLCRKCLNSPARRILAFGLQFFE